MDFSKDEVAEITAAIAAGFTPLGVALDVANLAVALKNLYMTQNDDNYFEVLMCVIAFIPGAGDGLKVGFKIVDRRPEVLIALLSLIITEYNRHVPQQKRIYGEPLKWVEGIVNINYIKKLISNAKKEAKEAAGKNIDNAYAKYWVNQSIDYSFNKLNEYIPRIIEVFLRKLVKWKSKVPHNSAVAVSHAHASSSSQAHPHASSTLPSQSTNRKTANHTTYDHKTGEHGKQGGNKGRTLSRSDIKAVFKDAYTGIVGEHMADYWVAHELGITEQVDKKVSHDSGQQPTRKLVRGMSRLGQVVNPKGIDAIWQSDKHTIGSMATKKYAIIEAKASLSITRKSAGTLLDDLDGAADDRERKQEKINAKKQNRPREKTTRREKRIENQQMSSKWVLSRLREENLEKVEISFSRHLVYFCPLSPSVETHMTALALSLQPDSDGKIDAKTHEKDHTPTQTFGAAEIDDAINKRIINTNKRNGYIK